jgi:hypothetical protein
MSSFKVIQGGCNWNLLLRKKRVQLGKMCLPNQGRLRFPTFPLRHEMEMTVVLSAILS